MSTKRSIPVVSIRRARVADAQELERIERESFASDHFTLRQFRYLVSRARGTVWVAVEDRALLGFIVVLAPSRWHCARVYNIAIARAARGKGLGRRLIERAWRWSRAQGRKSLILEVEQTNRAAIGLYEKLGFVRTRALRNYYGRGRHGWQYLYGKRE